MLIRISSNDHTDMLINPQKMTCVTETKEGCEIHFDNGNYIRTTASFKDVAKAMEQAVTPSED